MKRMQLHLSTRSRILTCLRHQAMTIAELSRDLAVTRTAVLGPLTELELKGLVRRVASVRSGHAGKPALRYEIVPEAVETISPAYQAIAPHLLKALAGSDAKATARAMKAIGLGVHTDACATYGTNGPLGLPNALAFLTSQGAEIEVLTEGRDTIVLSHSCPIGSLVRADRCICSSIAAFLSKASGRNAVSQCIYADKLTCRFRLAAIK
jgi:predicted ArsR family transcriptional regulator